MFAALVLRLLGWKKDPSSNVTTDHAVVVAYPHTCYMDTLLTLMLSFVYKGRVAAKADTLGFKLATIILGGIPIYRTKGKLSQTDQISNALLEKPQYLFISPEGSRSKVSKISSGFYHVAKKAGYPIICASLDFRTKTYSFSKHFYLDDMSYDDTLKRLQTHYHETGLIHGAKHPERVTPLALNMDAKLKPHSA